MNLKIAFLHGIACTGRVWDPLIAKLPEGWKSFAPDLLFHGRNWEPSAMVGYAIDDYARDLLGSLKKAGGLPVWLVGHSMGARVAVASALLDDEAIQGLILADHPVCASSEESRNFRILFRQFLADLDPSSLKERCPDPSSLEILSQSYGQWDKEAILKTFDALPSFRFGEALKTLGESGKPVLILRGGKSPFWTLEDWEETIRRFGSYDSFRLSEMKEAGHALPFETGDAFLKEMISFITASSARILPRTDGSSRR